MRWDRAHAETTTALSSSRPLHIVLIIGLNSCWIPFSSNMENYLLLKLSSFFVRHGDCKWGCFTQNTTECACLFVSFLIFINHCSSVFISGVSFDLNHLMSSPQRLKDEIAEVTSEIENLGSTEERWVGVPWQTTHTHLTYTDMLTLWVILEVKSD